MKIIATYLGHESSLTLYDNGKITIIELDKLIGEKWARVGDLPAVAVHETITEALEVCGHSDTVFDVWINGSVSKNVRNGTIWSAKLKNTIKYKRSIHGPGHHECHAWCALYQSPFDKAFIISSDGGGNDGHFVMYRGDKKDGPTVFESIDRFDFGTYYAVIGSLAPEIKENDSILNIAGKAMGLAGLYKRDGETTQRERSVRGAVLSAYADGNLTPLKNVLNIGNWRNEVLTLGKKNGKRITVKDPVEGRMLCHFNQVALETKFNSILTDRSYEVFSRYDGQLILTGGVAMNVILAEYLKNEFGLDVFVPCNPTDRGLSLGMLFWYLHLTGQEIDNKSLHFNGTPLIKDMPESTSRKATVKSIAKLLKKGAIIGVVEGDSEVGQRALGRRSIICDPTYPDMKDKINEQVKHRELYRPFAPVILEEHTKYFESVNFDHMQYMSFAVKATDECKEKFPAIVHGDGTSRVQITDDEGSLVYRLLEEIGHPLLNTSFNIQGQPIIVRESEAFEMLEKGGLDAIVVDGVLYKKPDFDK